MPRNARAAAAPAANTVATPAMAPLEARIAALTAELRDSEAQHARIIAAVAEGIYDWDIDTNALMPSPRLIEIFGLHGRELHASDWNVLVHPDDFPRYRDALRDCFRGITPRLDCEYRIRHSDGAYRWVEDRAVAVRNAAGRAIRLTGAITDVTSRKATEQALRGNEERYSVVSQAVAEGIYDWNVEQNTLFVSPRLMEIFRFDCPGLSSEDWYGLVHADDRERYRRALRDCFKGESPRVACEYRILVRSGDYRWVEDHGLPIRNAAGRAIRLVGAVSDITSRKAAEQALRESLEYQTATSDVLKVISRSTFDLQPVLNTLVETAARLCNADNAFIYLRDGGGLYRIAANFGFSREFEEYATLHPITPGPGTVTGRAAVERRAVHIHDVLADPGYTASKFQELGGYRTDLAVPLMREDAPIGVFVLTRAIVSPFTDRQVELVTTFADQAVIAIENARLITETREALEQQTATTEVLQVINASPGDLAPVFDTMLDKALRLCEAEIGVLWTYDGELMHPSAIRSPSPDYADFVRLGGPRRPAKPQEPLLQGEPFVQVTDLSATDGYRDGDPLVRAVVDLGGVRTLLNLALRKDDKVLGLFALYRREVRPFTDKQIALLRNFATQAVIAMENARLLGELRERTHDLEESLEYQTATSNVLQVISHSTFDLQPVFETIVATAARLCNAQTAFISSREEDAVRIRATFAVSPEFESFIGGRRLPLSRENVAGRTALEGRVVQVPDIANDPEFNLRESITIGKLRTVLGVPLSRDGTVVGVITLGREWVEAFTERQIELVRTFGDQAVIAIENARLLTELRESLEQQRAIAEILQVINTSPGELQPVFDVLLEKAMHLCGGAFGLMMMNEGDESQTVAVRGLPGALAAFRSGYRVPSFQGSLFDRVRDGEAFVHTLDLKDHDLYRQGNPLRLAMVDLGGARTSLFVPLRRDQDLLGAIHIYRQEVRPFSDNQIALLQSFAAQAVIAMDNARLLEEIRQRQAELRVTFDNMADGVAMFDAELRLAAWNMNFQRILDLPDEFVAQRPTLPEYFQYMAARGEYVSSELEAEIRRGVADASHEARFERTRPDGRVIEVRRNAVPGGGSVLIFSDITERKRAEAEIRAARDAAEAALGELKAAQAQLIHTEKMASLGQLTAGIAHEIKNPLNFVNNFATLSVELLDELNQMAGPGIATLDADTRADIDETIGMLTSNMEKIAEHGNRADGIVKSMLAHSRGSSGERQRVDLNALVDEALNLAYHGARAQDPGFNITLERDYAPALAPVEVVPQDITRVFLNLIGNGFYAATKRRDQTADPAFRPVLKVTTRELGHAVEIAVRDNGIGIAPELRDKLFQPFFTTKPTGEGTGLGLSISYDIVTQEHAGTIAVDSQIGAFTEFTVRLPRGPGGDLASYRATVQSPD